VSEESSTDAPGTAAARRRPPLWLSQTSPNVRILAAAAVVAVTAVIVAVVSAVVPASSSPPKVAYTRMPAPCQVLTAATVARYLPDATYSGKSEPVIDGVLVGSCNWTSISGGQARSLGMSIFIYESSSWRSGVQSQYQEFASTFSSGITGKGSTVSTRSVTGLGDQAVSIVVARAQVQGQPVPPQIGLVARSGNADFVFTYSISPIGPTPVPAIAAQVAATFVMARDALAALAHPKAVQATGPASSPLPSGPRYTSPRDACGLVESSTLAEHVPGTPPGTPGSTPGTPPETDCSWSTPQGSLTLFITINSDSAGAQQDYEIQLQSERHGGTGTKFDAAQTVTGLGQQASATVQTLQGMQAMWLDVWSGNGEVEFEFQNVPPDPTLSNAEKLATEIAMARDVLASLPR
jgi:hypothetical protein